MAQQQWSLPLSFPWLMEKSWRRGDRSAEFPFHLSQCHSVSVKYPCMAFWNGDNPPNKHPHRNPLTLPAITIPQPIPGSMYLLLTHLSKTSPLEGFFTQPQRHYLSAVLNTLLRSLLCFLTCNCFFLKVKSLPIRMVDWGNISTFACILYVFPKINKCFISMSLIYLVSNKIFHDIFLFTVISFWGLPFGSIFA